MKKILFILVMAFLAPETQAQEKPVNKETEVKLVELSPEGTAKKMKREFGKSPVSGFAPNPELNTKNDPVILNYDQNPFTAIGLSDGGTFSVAARFPTAMVAPYIGYELVSVYIYIWDFPFSCQIRIWGAGTSTTPGALLHQQSIVPAASSWNNVELSTPVALDGNDIWIGYTVGHFAGQFPAGCDSGPAHPEGAWISTNNVNWSRLYQIVPELNFNWNIRGYLLQGIILALEEEYLLDDSLHGNDDGILDPGETATLVMTVLNNGNDDLYDVQSVLSSADSLITINSGLHTIPVLPAGGTASVVFSVTAHEATPYGYPVELEVIAADLIPGLYSATQTYTILVGPEFLMPDSLTVDSVSLTASWTAPDIPPMIVDAELLNENWYTFSFLTNGWSFDPAQGNWDLDFWYGNIALSAMFKSHSAQTNYNFSLVSDEYDATLMPEVMLAYDLSLLNHSTTTLEQLSVEVWDGDSWQEIANHTNAGGNISWTTHTHDITTHVSGKLFQFRFRAHGINSTSLQKWNIDNIKIYGQQESGALYDLTGYEVFFDGEAAGTTAETNFTFPPGLANFGQKHEVSLKALYNEKKSHAINREFFSLYPYEPCLLTGEDAGHAALLIWENPGICVENIAAEASGFKVYRNDSLLATVGSEMLTYTDGWLAAGSYNYHITALYHINGVNVEQFHSGPLEVEISTEIILDLKVLLEGAAADERNALMHTSINHLLPLHQPFNPELPFYGNPAPVWHYDGTESLETMPENVLDWVLVEIRNSHDGMILERQAALLLNSGHIVDVNNQAIAFNRAYQQGIYVVVYQRNHVPVMSAEILTKSSEVYEWDFTTAQSKAFGNVLKDLESGLFAMYAGDGNGDGEINSHDISNAWNVGAGLAGYLAGDFNLNGQVQNQDKNNSWNPNQGILMNIIADVSNVMKIHDAVAMAGEHLIIDLEIINHGEFNAFQLDIQLPEGFDWVSGAISLNPDRTVDHIIQANVLPGTNIFRMLSYSLTNANFQGNSGIITSFTFITPSEPGTYFLTPEEGIIGNLVGENILTGLIHGTITLFEDAEALMASLSEEATKNEKALNGIYQDQELFWRFTNPQVLAGTPEIFQFDIEIKCSEAGTYHRDMQIYFDYNPEVFGSEIQFNQKITLTKIGVMAEEHSPGVLKYQWVNEDLYEGYGADNTNSRFVIFSEFVFDEPPSSTYHTLMPTEWTGFARVQIEIASPGLAGIQFNAPLMNGGQYFLDENGSPPGYAQTAHYENNLLEFETLFCEPPLNPEIDHVGVSTATLSWTAGGTGQVWMVSWGDAGFDPEISGNVTNGVHTNIYTITGLQPLTAYEAFVKTACTELNFSTWAGPVSFTTAGTGSNVWLENIIIAAGENFCYESTDTILVAGNGSHFIVENEGAAYIVAGKAVYLLPGVMVHENAYLRVWISDDGTFCTKQESFVGADEEKFPDKQIKISTPCNTLFMVYPNPTTGIFTLEVNDAQQDISLVVYGLMGERIIEKKLTGRNNYRFDLSHKPSGVYLVRIVKASKTGVLKLTKNQ